MKISNRLFNDQQIKQFSKQMENIQNVQNRISSGKNIIFASDDPVGAVAVHLICGMMKDKEHKEFIKRFKDAVKSITLIDIPNQEGSIPKEEFKEKLNENDVTKNKYKKQISDIKNEKIKESLIKLSKVYKKK